MPALGRGSLFDAIERNDLAAFSRLSRARAQIVDEHGRSLLFRAVLSGRTAIAARLIERGAPVNVKTRFAPLLAAAMRDRPREARLLLAAGADLERARDKDGDPLLVTAAFRESIAVLRVFLGVPHRAEVKSLALLEAAGVGNLPIVELLMKHGADPRWVSSSGNSAISIARKKKQAAIVAHFKRTTERPLRGRKA